MKDYLPTLQKTALFEGLCGAEIEALCAVLGCRRAFYPKGAVIFRRAERVETAGVVLSGGVRAESNASDGTLHIVAHQGMGALFGDVLSISRAAESPVDIVAAEDTEVLLIPLGALMRDAGPACRGALERVRLNLLHALAEKYWALHRQIELLRAPTLRARLARRLLAERRERGSDSFTLSGTRETLAAELGVNRSALSRELGAMRREGLLRAERGSFTLLDVPRLYRCAEW